MVSKTVGMLLRVSSRSCDVVTMMHLCVCLREHVVYANCAVVVALVVAQLCVWSLSCEVVVMM